jgi:DNA-binding SARP family transcriptional activator
VEIVRGRVAVDGNPVAVAGREGELLFAIALQREPAPRDQLVEMLWPDIDEYAARNSFNVCLHKLRQHLGRDDLIVHEEDGYRLHAEAAVDLWEIERVSALLHGHRRIGDAQRGWLMRTWNDLRRGLPGRMRGWEWFAPTERRLGQLRIEIGERLASDALTAGDADGALSFASDMIEYDPCDEPARELAIRANLLLGDRAAAMRQFRQYRQTLQKELQCEPSPRLAAMLSA